MAIAAPGGQRVKACASSQGIPYRFAAIRRQRGPQAALRSGGVFAVIRFSFSPKKKPRRMPMFTQAKSKMAINSGFFMATFYFEKRYLVLSSFSGRAE